MPRVLIRVSILAWRETERNQGFVPEGDDMPDTSRVVKCRNGILS
jgi:hypothetical protein